METVQNGCRLILHNLFEDNLIQKHNALAVSILEDLFERNNQVERNLFEFKPHSFKQEAKFRIWCDNSEIFLKNLEFDILLIREVGYSNWTPKLLQQACKLVVVLLELSDSLISTLQKIEPNSGPDISNTQLPGSAENSMIKARNALKLRAEAAWRETINYLKESMKNEGDEREVNNQIEELCSLAKDAPISGATFRELVLQNGIYHKWHSLTKTASQGPVSMEDCATVIGNIWKNMKVTKVDHKAPAWIPKILVVAIDQHTGMICTGATQANCSGLPSFQNITKEITRRRLRNPFMELIDACTQSFIKQADAARTMKTRVDKQWPAADTVEDVYRELVVECLPAEHKSLPTPGQDSTILCFAFHGHTDEFEAQAPCLRCQRFYPKWDLYKHPETSDEKKAMLESNNGGLDAPYTRQAWSKSKGTDTACCAETVAAAKIFALRSGKLALITIS